ncbi:MAG: right-handed parallel beta-helix repeat-containing protein [Firmicutes bacterium]|nr:right-handed parallel beta-helix repeat-containing protein [Bacillota bacterium]
MKHKRTAIRIILGTLFMLAMMLGMSATVWANEPVSYVEYTYSNGTLSSEIKTVSDYTVFPDDFVDYEGISGWYVVDGNDIDALSDIKVNGTLNLILCDGAKLNATYYGIIVGKNDTLNIYGQSADTGELNIECHISDVERKSYAAIGTNDNSEAGTINIHGGTIIAQGGDWAAGIGGGFDYDELGGKGGTVTIYNGNVTARGGVSAAGIGGGEYANGGNVTIYGGTVTAKAGNGGKGIGAGFTSHSHGDLILGKDVKLYGDANTDPPTELLATGDGTAYTGDRYRCMKATAEHNHGDITFKPWTASDSLPDEEGSYYLTQDVDLGSDSWDVPAGTTNLCLNKHNITSEEDDDGTIVLNKRNSTLNLYDEGTGESAGVISSKEEDGVLLDEESTTFNMYGGKISNCDDYGVDLNESDSKFNMYNGEISFCYDGVDLSSGTVFTLYNGDIKNNSVSGVDSYGTTIIENGSITNNKTGVYIHNMHLDTTGVFLQGSGIAPVITGNTEHNLLLEGSSEVKIKVSDGTTISGNARIGVYPVNGSNVMTGVFTDGLSGKLPEGKTAADIFTSDDNNYSVSSTTDGEAQLEKNEQPTASYELKYDPGDGGTGTMTPVTVREGQEYTFPKCTFEAKPGKAFDHWKMSGVDGIFYPDDANFNKVVISSNCATDGVVTVTACWKDAATVMNPPAATNPTYSGSAQELVTAGEAKNGTMQYAIGIDGTAAPTEGWSSDIPTGTDAATYYVWYKAAGDKSYGDSDPAVVEATIVKKDATVTAKDQTIKEGDSIKEGTDQAELTGALNGHVLDEITLTADTTAKTITPDAAKIIDSNKTNVTGNYNIKYAAGRLTIEAPTPAEIVADEIRALPDPVTLADKEQVDKVKGDFDALEESQQKVIPAEMVNKLNKAVDTIAVLTVSEQIAGLPEPVTLDDEAVVDAAVNAYLALTDNQKAIFSEMDLQKLASAEDVIITGKAEAKGTKVVKAKNKKGRKVLVKWQATPDVTGYQVLYSKKKNFKKGVKTKEAKKTAKKITLKKLKKRKIYYIQVKPYTEVTNRITGKSNVVLGKALNKKKVKIKK